MWCSWSVDAGKSGVSWCDDLRQLTLTHFKVAAGAWVHTPKKTDPNFVSTTTSTRNFALYSSSEQLISIMHWVPTLHCYRHYLPCCIIIKIISMLFIPSKPELRPLCLCLSVLAALGSISSTWLWIWSEKFNFKTERKRLQWEHLWPYFQLLFSLEWKTRRRWVRGTWVCVCVCRGVNRWTDGLLLCFTGLQPGQDCSLLPRRHQTAAGG